MNARWRVLVWLSLAVLLAMALWFSATAVLPQLTAEWQLGSAGRAWLTMAVQIGFVVGTFVSALFNLPDVLSARRLFFFSTIGGALCNGAIGLFVDRIEPALALRFATGFFLAGVYPPGMKLMATWFKKGRGMAIGVLVGALTVGSASPHLLNVLGPPDWRVLMLVASGSALLAGLICLIFVTEGPYRAGVATFDWRYVGRSWKSQGVRLANFGYLGHMWEVYAVWTWVPLFLYESFHRSGMSNAPIVAAFAGFGTIAVGGVGCVVAGMLADRYGRTMVTMVAMIMSGSCCIVAGSFFGSHPAVLVTLCLIWGVAVVADSAQFSAAVTELAEPEYIGTALTLQTGAGFLLTLGSIRLVPVLADWWGWQWAFAGIAIGPALGTLAMYRLRNSPAIANVGGEHRGPPT